MRPRLMSSVATLFLLGALLQVVAAVDHDVGGDFGWNLPPNTTFFSNWARNKTFSVGDQLVFRSKTGEHFVAEPRSQEEFDGCVKPGIVFSTSAVFGITLNGPGRRYFICTNGNHCNDGMKFAIDVLAKPGAPNSALPPSSASSLRFGALLAALAGFLLTILA